MATTPKKQTPAQRKAAAQRRATSQQTEATQGKETENKLGTPPGAPATPTADAQLPAATPTAPAAPAAQPQSAASKAAADAIATAKKENAQRAQDEATGKVAAPPGRAAPQVPSSPPVGDQGTPTDAEVAAALAQTGNAGYEDRDEAADGIEFEAEGLELTPYEAQAGVGGGNRRTIKQGEDVFAPAMAMEIHTDASPAGWVPVRMDVMQSVLQQLHKAQAQVKLNGPLYEIQGEEFAKQEGGNFYLRLTLPTLPDGDVRPVTSLTLEELMDCVAHTLRDAISFKSSKAEANELAVAHGLPPMPLGTSG